MTQANHALRPLLLMLMLLMSVQCTTARTHRQSRDHEALVRKTLQLKGYDALRASGPWEITLRQGAKEQVEIEFPAEYEKNIVVSVEGGVLKFETKNLVGRRGYDISLHATVSVRDLKSIDVSGGAEVNAQGTIEHQGAFSVHGSGGAEVDGLQLKCSKLSIDLTGAAELSARLLSSADLHAKLTGASEVDIEGLSSDECRVIMSGASELDLSGRSSRFIAKVSGASSLDADELMAEEVDITASGASNASVYASKRIDAKASGASHITYKGNPNNTNTDLSGASTIRSK